jgi:hypothetical protein
MKIKTGMAIALLTLFTGRAWSFDLTPDRGELAPSLTTYNYKFTVFNIGLTDWATTSSGYVWTKSQWRGEDGKRIGTVEIKTSSAQYDMSSITNGWFTPNPQNSGSSGGQNHISRGWQDTYYNTMSDQPPSTTTRPTFHVRANPNGVFTGDENRVNDEAWITTQWNATEGSFVAMENVPIVLGDKSLVPGDSVFYGAYSTNPASGNLTMTGVTTYHNRTYTLVNGDQKIGYQGRRMTANLTQGARTRYVISSGSKVTAEFLGQNVY